MKDKILDWLKKTGYPLELFGESILSEKGFQIVNSLIYTDYENKSQREIDLLANLNVAKDNIELDIYLLIECKKTDKPLILLVTDDFSTDSISINGYANSNNPNYKIPFSEDLKIKLPGRYSFGFKVIQAFTDGDEFIHRAANTLLKSIIDYSFQKENSLNFNIENNIHSFAMPILLVDAPLLKLNLDKQNEMQLEEIDSCILEFRNQVSDSPLYFEIPIIRKEFFREFCNNFENLPTSILNFLIANPDFQMKNQTRLE